MLGDNAVYIHTYIHTYIHIYSVVSPVLLHKAGDVGC